MTYPSKHRFAIEFYFSNKKVIDSAKYQAHAVLMYLQKRSRLITEPMEISEKLVISENTLIVRFAAVLVGINKNIILRFKIKLQQPQSTGYRGQVRTHVDGNVVIETMFTASVTGLTILVEQELQNYVEGILNEHSFLYDFLIPLQKRYPTKIIRAHYAGARSDLRCGVDFVVQYHPPDSLHAMEVRFNLKSSSVYIEKHKKRYPSVSTFIYRRNYLYDQKRLTRTFFGFLKDACTFSVAHC